MPRLVQLAVLSADTVNTDDPTQLIPLTESAGVPQCVSVLQCLVANAYEACRARHVQELSEQRITLTNIDPLYVFVAPEYPRDTSGGAHEEDYVEEDRVIRELCRVSAEFGEMVFIPVTTTWKTPPAPDRYNSAYVFHGGDVVHRYSTTGAGNCSPHFAIAGLEFALEVHGDARQPCRVAPSKHVDLHIVVSASPAGPAASNVAKTNGWVMQADTTTITISQVLADARATPAFDMTAPIQANFDRIKRGEERLRAAIEERRSYHAAAYQQSLNRKTKKIPMGPVSLLHQTLLILP